MLELVAPYPNTEFIDQTVESMHPLGVGLVRAVYLAQHFGQAHAGLTDVLAEVSAGEVDYWLPEEKRDYPAIRNRVAAFFANQGAERLAEASTAGIDPVDAGLVRGIKTDFLDRSWRVCQAALPSPEVLRNFTPVHEQLREQNRPRSFLEELGDDILHPLRLLKGTTEEWRDTRFKLDITNRFMMVDAAAIAEGRRPGTFVSDPHESMTREAVLMRRPTGSATFNLLFSRMQSLAAANAVQPGFRAAARAWSEQHPGELFVLEQNQRARLESLSIRVAKLFASFVRSDPRL